MDKPSEGLARVLVRELGRILVELKRAGAAILLVEQHRPFALRVADYVHLRSTGRIVVASAGGVADGWCPARGVAGW